MTTRTPVSKPAARKPAAKKPAVARVAPAKARAAEPVPAPVLAETPAVEQPVAPIATLVAEVVETPAAETIIETVAAAAPVAPAAIIKKEVTKMTDTIKDGADKGQAYLADFSAKAKAVAEKGTRAFEELNEFGKGNVEALVESGKIAAKGFETLGQGYAEYARKQFEGTTAAWKTFAGAKSPTEFFKLHTDFVKGQFDSLVAETSKNTETLIKLAGDVAKPISNRVAVAAEKVKIAA